MVITGLILRLSTSDAWTLNASYTLHFPHYPCDRRDRFLVCSYRELCELLPNIGWAAQAKTVRD